MFEYQSDYVRNKEKERSEKLRTIFDIIVGILFGVILGFIFLR